MKRSASIIIPVYNEEEILSSQVKKIITKIHDVLPRLAYEIILVENGSTDDTLRKAHELELEYKQVRAVRISQPSYGLAFKAGVTHATGDAVVQFDIDFWDVSFMEKALILLDQYDIVIGSKNLSHSFDQRPLGRRLMSRFVEYFINGWFGVHITDTHGLKVMKREKILSPLKKVKLTNHFLDSELLLRCHFLGYRFIELPVDLKEIRASRFSVFLRARQVAFELLQLLTIRKFIVANT